MTDREKAIIMAHTGVCMLAGDKFQIFHKYIEDICGRPIYTHELANNLLSEELKEKSKPDFIALCEDNAQGEWISVEERMPKGGGDYLVTTVGKSINGKNDIYQTERMGLIYRDGWEWHDGYKYEREWDNCKVIAWMPLPSPFKGKEQS